jgi:hypothetical protein
MVVKEWEFGTRRTVVAAMAVLLLTAIMLALPESALALPSEVPDDTPMVDGRVRAIEQVGTNLWLGGKFTQVEKRDGSFLGSVSNLAVFNSETNKFKDIAPALGDTNSEVWDMALYGKNVLIAGSFPGPTSTQKNLVLVKGSGANAGQVIRWYNSPSLKSVLAAPGLGRIYGGGVSLSAFDFATGKKLWTTAKTAVDSTIRTHDSSPAYRDLELDGQTIWAACICDEVDGQPAKALIKLDIDGNGLAIHDTRWQTEAGEAAFGQSVVDHNGKLYLAAGGSDFLAEYDKTARGARSWVRDTSGSAQTVAVYDGQLVVGGHFYEVADNAGDNCGAGRPGDLDKNGIPTLDPNNECAPRQGIAAYSLDPLDGQPDLVNWAPAYSGSYSLVWELHVEGLRLHTGGQFKTLSGVVQNSYARLSPASL